MWILFAQISEWWAAGLVALGGFVGAALVAISKFKDSDAERKIKLGAAEAERKLKLEAADAERHLRLEAAEAERKIKAAATNMETTAAAVEDYKEICDRQEQQIARQEKHIQEQQSVISRLQDMLGECREQSAELYGFIRLLHADSGRKHAALCSAGIACDPVEPLPPFKSFSREAEFLARTTAENTILNKEINKALPGSSK